MSRLDWTSGANASLTTDAGAADAVSRKLPSPWCGLSVSIAIVLEPAGFVSNRQPLRAPPGSALGVDVSFGELDACETADTDGGRWGFSTGSKPGFVGSTEAAPR